MADYGGDLVDEIRRRNEEELMRRVIEETKMGLRRLGPAPGPLPIAPNELGPPGDSSGLFGTAGEGGYDLAIGPVPLGGKKAAKTRKRRRAALGMA